MKKKHRVFNKKLLITNGRAGQYVDADTFAELACISKKHAYRLMSNPEKISEGMYRLVSMQLLGTVPCWPEGWRIIDDLVYPAGGRPINVRQVENVALFIQMEDSYLNRINNLQKKIEELEEQLRKPRAVPNVVKPKRRVLEIVRKTSNL